jgi:adenylate cyclase
VTCKVLLVDDQAIIGEAVRRMFAGEDDIELIYCQDGTAAVARALEVAPTVILQDLVMPSIDGITLVGLYRAEEALRDVPLVVLSTKEEPQTKAAAFAAGANDYLVKLPDRLEMLARIRYHSASYRSMQQRNQAYAFIRDTFGRYVSDEIVTSLLETPDGLKLGGERRRVSILMADMRGFSALADTLPPEQVVSLLNNYLEVMTKVIARHGGTIDELIGDAILALFGAPIQRADDARRAVACALEMQLAVPRVNERNRIEGLPAIEIGVGIDTGEVVAGNIGSRQRAKYGIVGAHVNATARIESYTMGGQVLISNATRIEAGEDLTVAAEMEIELKGSKALVSVFSVTGIGAPYQLALPEPDGEPGVAVDLPVRFSTAEEPTGRLGAVIRLSQTEAEIAHDGAPEPGAWIRLEILDEVGTVRWGGVRGKVTARPSRHGFWIRFSPISRDIVAFVRKPA